MIHLSQLHLIYVFRGNVYTSVRSLSILFYDLQSILTGQTALLPWTQIAWGLKTTSLKTTYYFLFVCTCVYMCECVLRHALQMLVHWHNQQNYNSDSVTTTLMPTQQMNANIRSDCIVLLCRETTVFGLEKLICNRLWGWACRPHWDPNRWEATLWSFQSCCCCFCCAVLHPCCSLKGEMWSWRAASTHQDLAVEMASPANWDLTSVALSLPQSEH